MWYLWRLSITNRFHTDDIWIVSMCNVDMCLWSKEESRKPLEQIEHLKLVWHSEWRLSFALVLNIFPHVLHSKLCSNIKSVIGLFFASSFCVSSFSCVSSVSVSFSEVKYWSCISSIWLVSKCLFNNESILKPFEHTLHRKPVWHNICRPNLFLVWKVFPHVLQSKRLFPSFSGDKLGSISSPLREFPSNKSDCCSKTSSNSFLKAKKTAH